MAFSTPTMRREIARADSPASTATPVEGTPPPTSGDRVLGFPANGPPFDHTPGPRREGE
jgi:hypothetical protein